MPPPEQRNGTLALRWLRQPQRATPMRFSVAHLGTSARIFDDRNIALNSVAWV
jgi:hypothetical protein